MNDQRDELGVAVRCRNLVDRALRQLSRLHEAHAVRHEATQRSGFRSGTKPKALVDLDTEFGDHQYFAILAVSHALKAATVLSERGEEMPEVRQSAALRAWRNVEEHWDDPEKGKPLHALKTWQSLSNSAAPGFFYTTVEDDGELVDISGVNLRRLMSDLRKLRAAAARVSEREWNLLCLTAEQAAKLMGLSVEEFASLPVKPHYMDFGPEHGIRYFRESVVNHARLRPMPHGSSPPTGG